MLHYKDKYIANLKNKFNKTIISFHEYEDYSSCSDLSFNCNMFDWKYDRNPLIEVEKESTLDKEKNAESSSKNRVEASANRLYFYSEVNRGNILTLNKYLKNMEANLLNRGNTWGTEAPEIFLHI